MDLKNLQGRKKALITLLIAAVGFSFYMQSIYKPLAKDIAKFQREIDKAQERLRELTVKFPKTNQQKSRLYILKGEYDELSRQITTIEENLPGQKDASVLLGELTRCARGVELIAIKQKIDRQAEYPYIHIELMFNAPYQEIINYINAVEAISPFLIIDELKVSGEDGKNIMANPAAQLFISSILGEVSSADGFRTKGKISPILAKRDIFVSKAKPTPKPKKLDLELEGVTLSPKGSTAIIDGDVVRVGSKVDEFKVKEILPDSVVLTDEFGDYVLYIER